MSQRLVTIATVVVWGLLAGCHADPSKGWSSKSIFTSEVKTISVPIANNSTHYREIGFLLTDAVIKEMEWKHGQVLHCRTSCVLCRAMQPSGTPCPLPGPLVDACLFHIPLLPGHI